MNKTPIIIAAVIVAIIVICCCSLFALFWTIGSWQKSQEPYSYGSRLSQLPANETRGPCVAQELYVVQTVCVAQTACVAQMPCIAQPIQTESGAHGNGQ